MVPGVPRVNRRNLLKSLGVFLGLSPIAFKINIPSIKPKIDSSMWSMPSPLSVHNWIWDKLVKRERAELNALCAGRKKLLPQDWDCIDERWNYDFCTIEGPSASCPECDSGDVDILSFHPETNEPLYDGGAYSCNSCSHKETETR